MNPPSQPQMTSPAEASDATSRHAVNSRYLSPYGWYAVSLLILSVATLSHTYLHPLLFAPDTLTSQVIVHGAVFIGWYSLVVFQSRQIAKRNVALHKRLGYLSIAFGLYLIASGAIMLVGVMSSYDPSWSEQFLVSRTSFVWAILHTLIFFGGSFALAILFRKSREIHKRLILMASLSMIAPSVTRVAYLPFVPIDGTAFTLLVTYVFLLIPFLLDRLHQGKVHPVFKYGIPLYAATQIVALGVMPTTPFGLSFAFGL